MGETAAETQREIALIRADLDATLDELERRARRMVDVRAGAAEHPALVGAVAVGGLVLLGALSWRMVTGIQARRREERTLRGRTRRLAGDLAERWDISTPLARRGRDLERSTSEESMQRRLRSPSPIKQLLWMGLTAGMVALFGLLARRLSSGIWEAVMHEPPPTQRV